MINHWRVRGYPVGRTGRLMLVLAGGFLSAGFVLALSVEPDARGFGTHEQFGLPQCTVRAVFGMPCPSCGMTTSFAHFIRAHFVRSIQANSAGFLLAATCAILIPWSWYSAARGELWCVSQPHVAFLGLAATLCGVSVLHWSLKLTVL
jgi:hypothetical protein